MHQTRTKLVEPKHSAITSMVIDGLRATPKRLPPTLFYDQHGSHLFDRITELPEYYLTRTEESIFVDHADEIARAAGPVDSVVELGAGSARKTLFLLESLRRSSRVEFYPVDVSSSALEIAKARVESRFNDIRVHPLTMDYVSHTSELATIPGRKLVLYIGSSVGNFEPFAASALLSRIHASLNRGDALLLGTDMQKPASVLLPAYDDSANVTAAFNKNVLHRINRELDANFDLDAFAHRAIWNAEDSRIEMHLESLCDQSVTIRAAELDVEFVRGETIHTENSYKFTPQMIASVASNSGFTIEQTWTDPNQWFTVHLFRA